MTDWRQYGKDDAVLPQPPDFRALANMDDPRGYLPSDALVAAVNVAVTLGMPLLVTGKPGTGKTQLAWHVAHRFGQQAPIVFDAKTTSTAQDLFYRYDALRHFQATSVQRAKAATAPTEHNADDEKSETYRYITFQALGLASLLASSDPRAEEHLPAGYRGSRPRRSVVLIDEIDKAPTDLPNDILREIETLSFTVAETGDRLPPGGIDPRFRPIVILTSNREKSLPEAFLRRCAFFHIPRPTTQDLRTILTRRLIGSGNAFPAAAVSEAVDLFEQLRTNANLRKEPSTAELIQWIRMLGDSGKTPADIRSQDADALGITVAVMATEEADAERIRSTVAKKS